MKEMVKAKLVYVERNMSRHGLARYYFRRDGKRICRLPDDPDSEEFSKAYWAARAGSPLLPLDTPKPKDAVKPIKQNSFRWLCAGYLASDTFLTLDDATKGKRRAIIDGMMQEPISDGDKRTFADMPVSKITPANLKVLKLRKRETPFAADERLKVLRQVFAYALDTGVARDNVAAKGKTISETH